MEIEASEAQTPLLKRRCGYSERKGGKRASGQGGSVRKKSSWPSSNLGRGTRTISVGGPKTGGRRVPMRGSKDWGKAWTGKNARQTGIDSS